MPARTSDSAGQDDEFALATQFAAVDLDLSGEEDEQTCDLDSRGRKRSPNVTECVRVPSSEHVAEIVGRQGCKIKALRARTNTYIKTPVRGQEPMFVITGRKEDVARCKYEIQLAVQHFTQLRCQRQAGEQTQEPETQASATPFTSLIAPSSVHAALAHLANIPGNVSVRVPVPVNLIGLIVGPKGLTIKRIQQLTKTYIVTPSRDKDSVFQITGSPDGVERATREIEQHVLARTGYCLPELLQRKALLGSARPSLTDSVSSVSSGCSVLTDSALLASNKLDGDFAARLALLPLPGNGKRDWTAHSDAIADFLACSASLCVGGSDRNGKRNGETQDGATRSGFFDLNVSQWYSYSQNQSLSHHSSEDQVESSECPVALARQLGLLRAPHDANKRTPC